MPAPFSQNDDTPELDGRTNLISLSTLRRQRDDALRYMDDVIRMVERQRVGDASFTGPGCGVTLALAANAMDVFKGSMMVLKDEVLPVRPLLVAKPFGRRVRDADLPAVASVGSI